MSITSDFHLHSSFSGDCSVSMEEMVRAGIDKGLVSMCFTEHNDFDFPYEHSDLPADAFVLNVDSYLYELLRLRRKYEGAIELLFGIEIGLQPSCLRQNLILSKGYDFDFIIASSHLCGGRDPYDPSFFEGKDPAACCRAYFEEILDNARRFLNFDVYGHLDYIARYLPPLAPPYRCQDYMDLIDEILTLLIENEKGIECNTSGLRKPLFSTNPAPAVLRRYRELGGEIVTVGSDAHTPGDIAADFAAASEILQSCGFRYYATYQNRHPEFHRL